MDEKELMMPLELGYVQVENNVSFFFWQLIKSVIYQVSDCHLCFFFFLKKTGGGEKRESKRWRGGRRARWPTMPPVARN